MWSFCVIHRVSQQLLCLHAEDTTRQKRKQQHTRQKQTLSPPEKNNPPKLELIDQTKAHKYLFKFAKDFVIQTPWHLQKHWAEPISLSMISQ